MFTSSLLHNNPACTDSLLTVAASSALNWAYTNDRPLSQGYLVASKHLTEFYDISGLADTITLDELMLDFDAKMEAQVQAIESDYIASTLSNKEMVWVERYLNWEKHLSE